MDIERRSTVELRSSNGRLEGYAAVWDAWSADLGGFRERVQQGAFTRSLRKPDGILALYDHISPYVLGRVGAGTLKLAEDTRGLHFDIDLPPTSVAKDLLVSVERQDVSGASFGFSVNTNGDEWRETRQGLERTLKDVKLHEITVTSIPAYPDTSVAKRRMPRPRLGIALRILETI